MEHNTLSSILKHVSNSLKYNFSSKEIQTIKKYIAEAVLNIPYHQVFLNTHLKIDDGKVLEIDRIIADLIAGMPVQYAVGVAYFSDLVLNVNSSVLIPRPETEQMISLIVDSNEDDSPAILDIGTGSGCIALALAKHIKGARVTTVDISADALAIAKQNAIDNELNINLMQVDILESTVLPSYRFNMVVSNPPYVRDSEKRLMGQNVLDYEPHLALFVPDSDPLRFYKAIAMHSVNWLVPSGWLWVEINEAFGPDVVDLLKSYGFVHIGLLNDFRGKPRFIKAQMVSND